MEINISQLVGMLAVIGTMISAWISLNNRVTKVETKVDTKFQANDLEIKAMKDETKGFREEIREDMKELRGDIHKIMIKVGA